MEVVCAVREILKQTVLCYMSYPGVLDKTAGIVVDFDFYLLPWLQASESEFGSTALTSLLLQNIQPGLDRPSAPALPPPDEAITNNAFDVWLFI